jgi:hypothetical protein
MWRVIVPLFVLLIVDAKRMDQGLVDHLGLSFNLRLNCGG